MKKIIVALVMLCGSPAMANEYQLCQDMDEGNGQCGTPIKASSLPAAIGKLGKIAEQAGLSTWYVVRGENVVFTYDSRTEVAK